MTSLYSYYVQILFLSLIIIDHLTEIYLTRRQLKAYQDHRAAPPPEFTAAVSPQDHQKAIAYASARLGLSQIRLIWDAAILLYWFPFRGAEKLYLALPAQDLHHEVLFLVSFSLIQFILSLPWSVYSTFVLEERFGFNRSTPALFLKDRLKGLALGGLFGVPLIYGLLLLYQNLGHWWWVVSFVVVSAFQLFLLWIYPSFIAPLFNTFRPLESEELKSDIQRLVGSAGFEAREIFVMDASKRSSHGNAYFTGLGKNKRVVFFDTLIRDLSRAEILAILAHELGHMKLRHIPKSLVTSLALSFVGFWFMGQVAEQNWFYTGHFFRAVSPGGLLLIFAQAFPVYTFWFAPLSSWVSRRREFEADAYAAAETGPEDLVSGLLKLYQQNASPVVTDKAYSVFYHSHPPALERIRRLRSLERKACE